MNKIIAFIVHGRDLEACKALSSTLSSIGVEVRLFKDVEDTMGGSPYVADIYERGISECDVCIVLFTPDDYAAYYDPKTGAPDKDPKSRRWQARANVIFEAGFALALKRERTILVAIGKHKEVFSDIEGIQLLVLDDSTGRDRLRSRIQDTVVGKSSLLQNHQGSTQPTYSQVARERWEMHDELADLEAALELSIPQGRHQNKTSLLTQIRSLVTQDFNSQGQLIQWTHNSTEMFFRCLQNRYGSKSLRDWAFWELLHHGFVQVPREEPYWGNEDPDNAGNWIPHALIAKRGLALIAKIRSQH